MHTIDGQCKLLNPRCHTIPFRCRKFSCQSNHTSSHNLTKLKDRALHGPLRVDLPYRTPTSAFSGHGLTFCRISHCLTFSQSLKSAHTILAVVRQRAEASRPVILCCQLQSWPWTSWARECISLGRRPYWLHWAICGSRAYTEGVSSHCVCQGKEWSKRQKFQRANHQGTLVHAQSTFCL